MTKLIFFILCVLFTWVQWGIDYFKDEYEDAIEEGGDGKNPYAYSYVYKKAVVGKPNKFDHDRYFIKKDPDGVRKEAHRPRGLELVSSNQYSGLGNDHSRYNHSSAQEAIDMEKYRRHFGSSDDFKPGQKDKKPSNNSPEDIHRSMQEVFGGLAHEMNRAIAEPLRGMAESMRDPMKQMARTMGDSVKQGFQAGQNLYTNQVPKKTHEFKIDDQPKMFKVDR